MQNIDFYSGKSNNTPQFLYNDHDTDYFSTISKPVDKGIEKSHNTANRHLVVILSLCIISFTAGLIIGLKYTNGASHEMIDPSTKQAMSQLGEKVNNFIDNDSSIKPVEEKKSNTAVAAVNDNGIKPDDAKVSKETEFKQNQTISKTFPKNEFPYVLQIDGKYTLRQSKDIASYLSRKGNTVLISKIAEQYCIYVGPFKNESSAKNSLQILKQYSDNNWYKNILLVKR